MSADKLVNSSDIIVSIVTMILTKQIGDMFDVISDAFIKPLLSIDLNNDGKGDLVDIEKKKIKVCGVNLAIGKFFLELVKFSIVISIIYLAVKISKSLENK